MEQPRLNPTTQSYNDSQFSNVPGQPRQSSHYHYNNPQQQPIRNSHETRHGRWQTQPQQQQHYPELPYTQGPLYTRGTGSNVAGQSFQQPNVSGHVCELCPVTSTFYELIFTDTGFGSSQPQNMGIPAVTTSFSLAGALGQPESARRSSPSSNKVVPTVPVQHYGALSQPEPARSSSSSFSSKVVPPQHHGAFVNQNGAVQKRSSITQGKNRPNGAEMTTVGRFFDLYENF